MRKAWLLIAEFFLFLSIRNYPFGFCCSEKNLTGFQQFKEFFRPVLLRGVTLGLSLNNLLVTLNYEMPRKALFQVFFPNFG